MLISLAATAISLFCGLLARRLRLVAAQIPVGRQPWDLDFHYAPGAADAAVHSARRHHPQFPSRRPSPWALILTYPTFLIPFCTWLLMGYFKSIPKELEECAPHRRRAAMEGDGLHHLSGGGLRAFSRAGIFAFTLSWNEFIYALVFLSSPEQKTVPVGVTSELVRGDVFFWGELMAGALLGSIPVAFVYSFFVEYYVSGISGSVKG